MTVPVIKSHLLESLRKLHLPMFVTHCVEQAQLATNDGWSYDRYLLSLCDLELNQRGKKRIDKLLLASRLPRDKTISTFDRNRLNRHLERKFAALSEADFLDRRENVLIFGNPGSGKSHQLVKKGRSVYFTECALLVQRLLRAKLELSLERELKRLDKYEALIIDDIAYVQQSREEMEVLFTLLAYRYERRSLLLTSNLIFSEWGKIFKDPMTTAAAIDRLVHHSVIIELNLPSYRMQAAAERKGLAATGTDG